jgi:hypothetical protein
VKYTASSLKSLKGIFTKDYWLGKKKAKEIDLTDHATANPFAPLADNSSLKTTATENSANSPLAESIYYDPETNSIASSSSETTESASEASIKDLTEPNFS